MSRTDHIIQRHIFDISFPVREKAYELQSRFSRLFDREAIPVMGEVFDELIPENLLLRLDTLTLDLGPIRHDRLEKDFPDRLRQALLKELQRVLQQRTPGEWQARAKTLMDLMEYFLLTGSLPWWAAGALLSDPVAVADRLTGEDPQGMRRLLSVVGQREEVRRRLVHQYPETAIRGMVEVLEPEEASFIFVYHEDIIRVRSAGPFFRQDIGEFRRSLWLFIFTYLLVERGSNFNRRIFVKSTLVQLARQYNMEYVSLINLLLTALEVATPALLRRSALPGIIYSLFEEEERHVVAAPPQSPADQAAEKIQRIRAWLLHGRLPGQQAVDDAPSLSAIFTQLIRQVPDAVDQLVRSFSGQEGIWARIVGSFDEGTVKDLVRLREPEEAEFIFHYAGRLAELQRRQFPVPTDSANFRQSVWEVILAYIWVDRGSLFNTRRFLEYNIRRISRRHHLSYRQLLAFLVQGIGGEIRSERDSTLFHSLALLLEESAEVEAAPSPPPVPKPSPPQPAAASPQPSPPAQPPGPSSPAYYIANAGLILLHPLLPHFLQRLGLTTPQHQFVDTAARHRAAHLLQYLVTGHPEDPPRPEHSPNPEAPPNPSAPGAPRLIHPEHQLVLNKLLCEIPIHEPVPLEIVVTTEELQLADQLFQALIHQWSKLGHTSVEGLQVSFLQRDGSLTEIQDGWRLRVQQRGIDVLLPYLPWGFSVVRLPWMHNTIYTEWT